MTKDNQKVQESAFSDKLNELFSLSPYSKSSLAKALNVSHTTVSRWLDGQIPKGDSLFGLASLLGVNVQWLLHGEGPKDPVNKKQVDEVLQEKAEVQTLKKNALHNSLIQIPVLSWAHAGQSMAYEEMPQGYLEPMTLPKDMVLGYEAIGARVDGDCMEPIIRHGDNIAMLKGCNPKNGGIVVAKFHEDYGVMVRHFQILTTIKGEPETIKLLPANTFYEATVHHMSEFEWIMPVAAMARNLM